ncbi:hypothetical protein CONPUDRAFT_160999 [Coniophora puteana RWD-64-598 SS2]|uniref:DUF6533 domain-containing protein n=1 Tax=Coniophora puteana (strain RWD-64-598) TaxID=741705 RepID=A0A5M3N427_CONPW|nr:uncharacterized protein CONPUDRAFT_160999 [Coniophora puteana RWD-64-598 SS2]EIW86180.1 hypothetical protein CONPUDRAFT_160999 [Coniophora puteana RWD-64-598 SS2]
MQDWDADAVLRSYQTRDYIGVAITAFWFYDYMIELNAECTFMRHARLRKTKVIYLLTRLLPFAARAARFKYDLSVSPTLTECKRLSNAMTGLTTLIVFLAEVLFALRTYALWRRSRAVLILLIVSFVVATIGSVAAWYIPVGAKTTIISLPRSSVTGCAIVTSRVSLALTYSFLIALEMELITLNAMRGIRVRRETRARLIEVLVRHNVLYYVCGLVFTITNVIMGVVENYGDVEIFQDLQIYIHAILSTRMHRMLWFNSEHDSDGLDVTTATAEPQ